LKNVETKELQAMIFLKVQGDDALDRLSVGEVIC
jgi:hypothetical protein